MKPVQTQSDACITIKHTKICDTVVYFLVFLLNMQEGSVHAPYRHILRMQIVESAYMAVDMKQVTLHYTFAYAYSRTHASTAPSTLYRCAVVKSSYAALLLWCVHALPSQR